MEILPGDPLLLFGFGYVSTPTTAFSDRDLSDLLLAARSFNHRHGVSGKLVVIEEGERVVRFAQWIEGPPEGLGLCIERILADPRHGAVNVQWQGETPIRRFAGWDMHYEAAPLEEWNGVAPGLVAG